VGPHVIEQREGSQKGILGYTKIRQSACGSDVVSQTCSNARAQAYRETMDVAERSLTSEKSPAHLHPQHVARILSPAQVSVNNQCHP
jgi:hypothetical protein